jgi:APA family basic amino acid/polyamine antiporter
MSIDSEPLVTPGQSGFKRGLGRLDSTMVVAGIMIGSGIFIVSAEMARLVCGAGWLLLAWAITGILTLAGALSYGELASLMPRAGGQYVYLRESLSPMWGFLYGWTLFAVIQTGTIAAVAVAFARFLGLLWPWISEEHYIVAPLLLSSGYAVSLSTAQLLAIGVIAGLTWLNSRGLDYGRVIQNVFTVTKIGILLGVTAVGLLLGWTRPVIEANFSDPWVRQGCHAIVPGLDATSTWGLLVALCVAQTGSLFAADAWHNIAYASEEVREARTTVPFAMAAGALIVIVLYLTTNVAYLATLTVTQIQQAPADRVGTSALQTIFPRFGPSIMATAIMISTFGAINALVLSGARVYYAMARDGLGCLAGRWRFRGSGQACW